MATTNPTAEQIERAAEALAAWDGFEWSGDWEGTVSRDAYRNGATLALRAAAAGVAPQKPSCGNAQCVGECGEHGVNLVPQEPSEYKDPEPWLCSHGTRAPHARAFQDGNCSVEYAPRPAPSPDHEKLIAEANELIQSWDARGSWTPDSPVGMVMQLRDALAAQPVLDQGDYQEGLEEGIKIGHAERKLDPVKVAALLPVPVVSSYVPDWPEDEREFYRNGSDDLSFQERGEVLDEMRKMKIARTICEAARRGELT